LLNSKARNTLLCALSEEEYTQVHNSRSAKQTWVKRNKLSVLTREYELFTMVEDEDIQCMFGHFQNILNELRYLGQTYDNYDHIAKNLRSLSSK